MRAPPATGLAFDKLIHRLSQARNRTDAFFGLLTPAALYQRAISERHRVIFYVGHLEAFDWNLLAQKLCGSPPLHPRYEQLFAFGIDPVDGALPDDAPSDWPETGKLLEYRARSR